MGKHKKSPSGKLETLCNAMCDSGVSQAQSYT